MHTELSEHPYMNWVKIELYKCTKWSVENTTQLTGCGSNWTRVEETVALVTRWVYRRCTTVLVAGKCFWRFAVCRWCLLACDHEGLREDYVIVVGVGVDDGAR